MSRFMLRALSTGITTAECFRPRRYRDHLVALHGRRAGRALERACRKLNPTQDGYRVTPSYRGEYEQTMVNTSTASGKNETLPTSYKFQVGTGTMMAAPGAIYPVFELMEEHGNTFDPVIICPW